ncbi:MAG TPA: helix-turn-helix transcriptional regulator [Chthoniobacterales bacterium]|nr:helix-turn-helix transcriptional regulator [Chthoniobacterales bacterium]
MPPEIPDSCPLTPRQREVMRWVGEGKTNWETATIVGCAEATVKKHLQQIYRQLHVANRIEAMLRFKL